MQRFLWIITNFKVISIIIVIFLLISVVVTTYLVQKRTQTKSEASEEVQQDQQPEYVPGEFIVKLKPSVPGRPSAPSTGPGSLEDLDQRFGVVEKETIFDATGTSDGTRQGAAPVQTFQEKAEEIKQRYPQRTQRAPADLQTPDLSSVSLYKLSDPNVNVQEVVNAYSAHPSVEYAEPNYIFTTQAVPNDPKYNQQWAPQKIQAEQAWDRTTGSGTIVAVIDTGIYTSHPDLSDKYISGYDFVNDSTYLTDENGHGTHVAGIIGATTDNNKGIAGVNWRTGLLGVKVFDDEGFGSTSDIVAGIQYSVDNGADVLNLSFQKRTLFGGGPFCTSLMQQAINYARSLGVVVVVAAGNNLYTGGEDANLYQPASCQGVITVGATGPDDSRARYSNYGSVVDLAAPGGDCKGWGLSGNCAIISTFPPNQYNRWHPDSWYWPLEGTSQAAPHVAGAASLLIGLKPDLTINAIENLLKQNTDLVSTSSSKPVGGRLNLYKAINNINSALSPKTYTLKPGWNILPSSVNAPLADNQNFYPMQSASKFCQISSDIIALYKFDSNSQSYIGYGCNGAGTDFGLQIGLGYWILVSKEVSFTLEPTRLPNHWTPSRQGWSLYAPIYGSNHTATTFFAEVSTRGTLCTHLFLWDNLSQTYKHFDKAAYEINPAFSENFVLDDTQGFWVYCQSS